MSPTYEELVGENVNGQDGDERIFALNRARWLAVDVQLLRVAEINVEHAITGTCSHVRPALHSQKARVLWKVTQVHFQSTSGKKFFDCGRAG
jgi:hypothetical protein